MQHNEARNSYEVRNTMKCAIKSTKGKKKMKKDYSKLGTLFRSMFMLSACTFGGGFVIVSLMKKNSEIGGKLKTYLV